MIDIKWSIEQIDRNNSNDAVFAIHWRLTGTKEGSVMVTSTIGSIGFKEPESTEGMIPYNELTEEILLGWLKNTLGPELIEMFEYDIEQRFRNAENNTYGIGVPWATIE